MPDFRCYMLNERGRIVLGETIEADTIANAIDMGWQYVASTAGANHAAGLEVWQRSTKLFSTAPNTVARNPPATGAHIAQTSL